MTAKLFNSFGGKEPAADAKRALEIPSRSLRNKTVTQVVGKWIADDGAAAAQKWMDDNLTPAQWEVTAADILVRQRGRRTDYKAYAGLAERLSPENESVARFIHNWESRNRESLEEWIGSKPATEQTPWRELLPP